MVVNALPSFPFRAHGISQSFTLMMTFSASSGLAANLRDTCFDLKIVLDEVESDDTLLTRESAMELPPSAHPEKSGLGFWGVVAAVIVALLILSLF